jgi:hypothetical protein
MLNKKYMRLANMRFTPFGFQPNTLRSLRFLSVLCVQSSTLGRKERKGDAKGAKSCT